LDLKDSHLNLLNELTKAEEHKKDTILIERGSIADKLIFLTSGIVSSVYENGSKRFIRDFYFPPQIFTEQESFIKKSASKFSVMAVTDIKCRTITSVDLEIAYKKIRPLRDIAYKMLMVGFVNISNRLESQLTLNPEQRYKKLLNENPKLLHNIPLKMIASYLGVTDVALSRIRKRISQTKNN
jgi:CRP-like cAMP-binding protein